MIFDRKKYLDVLLKGDGVTATQISRLERDYSITIPTMRRVFHALGVMTATIDLGIAGKVALW